MTIKASTHDVCEGLMDSEKPSQFTGAPTIIGREIGGSFTAYAGNLTGTILELVPDNKTYSLGRHPMTIGNHAIAPQQPFHWKLLTGTRLTFIQTGVPDRCYYAISQELQTCY